MTGATAAARVAAIPPVLVSDRTALAVLGMSPRNFRDFVRKHSIPHARVYRRTIARLDRVLEALDLLSGVQPLPQPVDARARVIARLVAGGR